MSSDTVFYQPTPMHLRLDNLLIRDFTLDDLPLMLRWLTNPIVLEFYDARFLVKPTASATHLMPDAPLELPYEGAKPMLLVDNVDDKDFLTRLFEEMYPELPAPKPAKTKKKDRIKR